MADTAFAPTTSAPAAASFAGRTVPLMLRGEGLVALGAAVAAYAMLRASWWLFAALFLAPDLAMLGYLGGRRIGAHVYNAAHTYIAPALLVGVGVVGHWPLLFALAAILGMAGYFAGVVQAPMTAFVIILEMTGDHQAVIPIMAVSMIGYVTSRILSREPLYHGLSRVFIAAAIRARRAAEKALEEPNPV